MIYYRKTTFHFYIPFPILTYYSRNNSRHLVDTKGEFIMYEVTEPKVKSPLAPIHIPGKPITPKYNPFQGGYGAHGPTKREKARQDRRNNKAICRKEY